MKYLSSLSIQIIKHWLTQLWRLRSLKSRTDKLEPREGQWCGIRADVSVKSEGRKKTDFLFHGSQVEKASFH